MRLLLDECVPRPLKRDLVGHDVSHVVDMGWSSKRNGELLRLMAVERHSANRQDDYLKIPFSFFPNPENKPFTARWICCFTFPWWTGHSCDGMLSPSLKYSL